MVGEVEGAGAEKVVLLGGVSGKKCDERRARGFGDSGRIGSEAYRMICLR